MIVSTKPRAKRTFQYGALVLYMLFLAVPLLWLLSTSFKTPQDLVALHPTLIPKTFTLQNFRDALHDADIVHSGLNSLKVALISSVLTTAVGLPAAYVLEIGRAHV